MEIDQYTELHGKLAKQAMFRITTEYCNSTTLYEGLGALVRRDRGFLRFFKPDWLADKLLATTQEVSVPKRTRMKQYYTVRQFKDDNVPVVMLPLQKYLELYVVDKFLSKSALANIKMSRTLFYGTPVEVDALTDDVDLRLLCESDQCSPRQILKGMYSLSQSFAIAWCLP